MTGNDIGDYLVRSARDGAVEFRIADAVVRAVSMEVMRGFGVTRRRGAEVGGLLLGSARRGLIEVDGFEIVPCEYAYGPSWLLSDNDLAKFGDAVARWRPAAGAQNYVVGWFRSHTRAGLGPDAPDLEILHSHFHGSPAALLLIKPFAARKPEAALYVSDGSRLSAEPAIEFTFGSPEASPPKQAGEAAAAIHVAEHELMSDAGPMKPATEPGAHVAKHEPASRERTAAHSPVTSKASAERAPEMAVPEPVRITPPIAGTEAKPVVLPPLPAEQRVFPDPVAHEAPAEPADRPVLPHRDLFQEYGPKPVPKLTRVLSWTAFALAAVFFFFTFGYRQAGGNLAGLLPSTAPRIERDPYALGLTTVLRGDSILIQWDRSATAVGRGLRANIAVTSAAGRHEFRLEPEELRHGIVLYKTDAAEAEIRLEIYLTPDRLIAEQTVWTRGAPAQN